MSAVDPLCRLIGVDPESLSKEEVLIVEANLFVNLCDELSGTFCEDYEKYVKLVKLAKERETIMLDANLVRVITLDILASKDYDVKGIAEYADTHEDVVYEACAGLNPNPSVGFFRRIIDLHRKVRPDLYAGLMKKMVGA